MRLVYLAFSSIPFLLLSPQRYPVARGVRTGPVLASVPDRGIGGC